VPLNAPSSPIVWGDRVFLTGSSKEKLEVYCFDVATGRLLWQQAASGIPGSPAERPKTMEGVGWSPATPATDGARVYAIFSTGDLMALDFSGQRAWARNLGTPDNAYGHASSLALWRNLLIVQYDQASADDRKSRLIALDAATGRSVWETRRDSPQTWATPIVVKTPAGEQIICSGDPWLCGYDPASGKELWRAECLGGEIAPSPTYANGVAYTANAGSYATAVRTDGSGDVTKTHILWKAEDGLPDICSPLTNGELVWALTTGGLLTCYDAKTGKRVWEHDVKENCESSPALAGDRVLVTTLKGVTRFVAASRELKVLGKAELGEGCRTSPAFLDGKIIIRGEKHLFCIGLKK
jgi:outer membrane protein assembly factor BamB